MTLSPIPAGHAANHDFSGTTALLQLKQFVFLRPDSQANDLRPNSFPHSFPARTIPAILRLCTVCVPLRKSAATLAPLRDSVPPWWMFLCREASIALSTTSATAPPAV